MTDTTSRWLHGGRRAVLYGTLTAWFGLTVLEQLQKGTKVNRRLDPLSAVIPNWRFFGPQPAMSDSHVLFRDELADGSVTDWQEAAVVEERRLSHMVWHPNRRREKVVVDAVEEMKVLTGLEQDLKKIQLAIPYLLLLTYVSKGCTHHPQTRRTQFLLASGPGYDEDGPEPTLFFASDFHALRRDPHAASV
ncbi:hypothetical protein [Kitasatospora sp. NPDC047058]|uniref:hypothetical protein n=1 Tax=Kitasatospora sp. NPDC047058 TaxID=3155620 RepID=UPI00340E3CD8